jgi:tetratricopeptide (TPR) repeat protein
VDGAPDPYSDTGRLAEADKADSEALTIYRDLAAHDPGAYRSGVATILNNLGNLYRDTGRLAEADKAYSETLTIYRDLESSNSKVYVGRITALTQLLATLRDKLPSSPHPYPVSFRLCINLDFCNSCLLAIWS